MAQEHTAGGSGTAARAAVTAADVELAVRAAIGTLAGAHAADWSVPAGELAWDCWETLEHAADALVGYATQLAPARPPLDGYLPYRWQRDRPEGPATVLHVDRAAGPAGLLRALDAGGGLLAATVRTAGPRVRAFHSYGVSDPEGFAAMGVVETLVHTHDAAAGLGLPWNPPAALCDRALARLFPEAPADTGRWPTLLWATGRAALPGHPRRTFERWHSAPLTERNDSEPHGN
ncbi:hypothetical protein [Kitasatospora cheerisanensis]|uniref:Mycothiol-dependent maleylpyruvate isomerase metal-binding domain-containing protein n=1 Tax=Kitasatospora cheerisanensis KCTC 2395 TaxID=1348663 RepID=A0A066YNY8_9ACTN|nr:hypothetical protein [Kitasatospora cheerisanensis]KDN81664.1 hypothetical protein KCH_63840 [Kitasatospora cheerisanensis KCTC 2395]